MRLVATGESEVRRAVMRTKRKSIRNYFFSNNSSKFRPGHRRDEIHPRFSPYLTGAVCKNTHRTKHHCKGEGPAGIERGTSKPHNISSTGD